jgi:hypothetical protein
MDADDGGGDLRSATEGQSDASSNAVASYRMFTSEHPTKHWPEPTKVATSDAGTNASLLPNEAVDAFNSLTSFSRPLLMRMNEVWVYAVLSRLVYMANLSEGFCRIQSSGMLSGVTLIRPSTRLSHVPHSHTWTFQLRSDSGFPSTRYAMKRPYYGTGHLRRRMNLIRQQGDFVEIGPASY